MIRVARPADYDRIEQLSAECGKERIWSNFILDTAENVFIPLQTEDPSLVLVAEVDNELVGFITADEFDREKKVVAIETVFVLSEYRQQGIGKALVEQFTRIWKYNHGFSIHLYAIGYDNYQFFKNLGFDFVLAKMKL